MNGINILLIIVSIIMTIYSQEEKQPSNYRIAIQYISVLDNGSILHNGMGVYATCLRQQPNRKLTIGCRAGYVQYNNIMVKNNTYRETGYPMIDNMIDITPKLPYKSGGLCGLIGGPRLQAIVGYGYLTNETVYMLGLNYTSNTPIGISASLNNLFAQYMYYPEFGLGLSIKF